MFRNPVVATALAILVYGMQSAALGTILPGISHRLVLTGGQNGLLAFLQGAGLIVAALSTGPLIDRYGLKCGVVFGLSLSAVSLLVLGSSPDFLIAATCVLGLGLGGGVTSTSTNAIGGSIGKQSERAATLNLLNMFFGLGGFITPFLASYLFTGDTERVCLVLAAAEVLVLAISLRITLPANPQASGFQLAGASRIARNPALILVCFYLFFYVGCEVGVWNWFAKYLVSAGMQERLALRILSFGFGLGMLSGRFFASRALSRTPVLLVTLVCSSLVVLFTWQMLTQSSAVILGLLTFAAGFAMGPVFPSLIAFVADRSRTMTATAVALGVTAGCLGQAMSSAIVGLVAGPASEHLRTGLYIVLPGFAAITVGLNLFLRTNWRANGARPAHIPA